MTLYIPIEPLTAESFAPFGDVVEFRGETVRHNQERCIKYPELAGINTGDSHSVNIHLTNQSEAIKLPFKLQVLECHPVGCQMFMPLNREPYLIVVAPGKDQPELEGIRCFIADRGQGVVYGPGVWHHPLLALADRAEFLMADAAGVGKNLVEVFLEQEEPRYICRLH